MIMAPLAVFAAVFSWGGLPEVLSLSRTPAAATTSDTQQADFDICGDGPRITCIVDGDTIWFQGEKIRLASINAPELFSPRCEREAQLARRATGRLQVLLNQGPFTIENPVFERDTDKYGRLLRNVTRGGQDLGVVLVREGLAESWQGYRRDWCG